MFAKRLLPCAAAALAGLLLASAASAGPARRHHHRHGHHRRHVPPHPKAARMSGTAHKPHPAVKLLMLPPVPITAKSHYMPPDGPHPGPPH